MKLKVKNSYGKGRGVFAVKGFKKDEIIEECPVIVIPEKEKRFIDKTILGNYYYEWGKNWKKAAIILGYGSLYNHSYNPNAYYKWDFKNSKLTYIALRKIKNNEEIRVNYNDPNDSEAVDWFIDAKIKAIK